MALDQVFVTNKNPEPHVDRYDGEEYIFPPGEAVLVPIDAAHHMFGYVPVELRREGEALDYTDTLVRLGKATKLDPETRRFVDDPEGVKWLARFVFEEPVVRPKSALERAMEGTELA
jgi:hypothetical protein